MTASSGAVGKRTPSRFCGKTPNASSAKCHALIPRVIATHFYPLGSVPSMRRSRVSIASRTNTNSRILSTPRGQCGRWSRARAGADDAGGRVQRQASPSTISCANRWRWSIPATGSSRLMSLGRLHGRGLVHKDIKPANVLVDSETGNVWLTGFGIALESRACANRPTLPRSWWAPLPTWRRSRRGG